MSFYEQSGRITPEAYLARSRVAAVRPENISDFTIAHLLISATHRKYDPMGCLTRIENRELLKAAMDVQMPPHHDIELWAYRNPEDLVYQARVLSGSVVRTWTPRLFDEPQALSQVCNTTFCGVCIELVRLSSARSSKALTAKESEYLDLIAGVLQTHLLPQYLLVDSTVAELVCDSQQRFRASTH